MRICEAEECQVEIKSMGNVQKEGYSKSNFFVKNEETDRGEAVKWASHRASEHEVQNVNRKDCLSGSSELGIRNAV